MVFALSLIASGLLVGILSGIFGIGGGVVAVPLLVMAFGFSQKLAQGTSLAMFLIAPSMLAIYTYFKAGNINFKATAFLWIGAFVGSFLGAYFINNVIPDSMMLPLRRAFAVLMVIIAAKMWFSA